MQKNLKEFKGILKNFRNLKSHVMYVVNTSFKEFKGILWNLKWISKNLEEFKRN